MQGLHVIGLCEFDGSLRFENKLASYLKEKVNVKKIRFETETGTGMFKMAGCWQILLKHCSKQFVYYINDGF